MKKFSVFLCTVMLLVAACLVVSGAATAATITLDGIFDGSDAYSESKTVTWFNGHKPAPDSIYGDFNNQTYETTIRYGAGQLAGDATGTDYFFLYADVPLYAKNMIWQDLDWKGTEYPVTNTDSTLGLTEANVSSY